MGLAETAETAETAKTDYIIRLITLAMIPLSEVLLLPVLYK